MWVVGYSGNLVCCAKVAVEKVTQARFRPLHVGEQNGSITRAGHKKAVSRAWKELGTEDISCVASSDQCQYNVCVRISDAQVLVVRTRQYVRSCFIPAYRVHATTVNGELYFQP